MFILEKYFSKYNPFIQIFIKMFMVISLELINPENFVKIVSDLESIDILNLPKYSNTIYLLFHICMI